MRSYRLACELSLEQACAQVNRLLDTFAGDPGYVTHPTLSRYEHWPTGKSRRPTVGHLAVLAQVYGTRARNLVADADWARFPPADRYTLQALDARAEPDAGATDAGTAASMMDPTRPQGGTTAHTPPNWWTVPEPVGSTNPIEKAVTMANEESARYADHAGNTGPATIDQLRQATAEQARRFANAPRLELFGSVRMLRDRIFALLDAGQPIRHRRDLNFLAAAACGMLAAVSLDLGYPAAGRSQARVGHIFAAEAEDPALIAWLYVREATICYWNGQPGKAREYARRGASLNPGGTVGVWLPAMEAQAGGVLGDAEGTRAAIRRAVDIRETLQPGTLDQFGGVMGLNQAKQHYCATSALLGIGDDAAVVTEAESAVEAYQTGPDDERAFDNMAIVRFQAAAAQVRAGDLDAATQSAQAAFDIAPQHRDARVDKTAEQLHHHLRTPTLRTAPPAVETRDHIEEFLTTTPAHPEFS